jgi:thiol-disulfide isomerase/thioredoxin
MSQRILARTAAAALVDGLVLTTAACSSGEVNDAAGGNGLTYIEGDGTVTIIPADQRTVAPAISGKTLDGSSYSTAGDAGSIVVANVWASWCAPCRAEAPALADLSRKLAKHDVAFVGINTRDQDAAARAFVDRFGITYPSIVDSDGTLLLGLGSQAPRNIPSTLVFDQDGRIAATVSGSISYSGLSDLVQKVATGSP